MQDKDFDALLKRKFEFLEGSPGQGKAWNDLSSQLDAFDAQRRRKANLLYALLVAALLLGHLAWVLNWLNADSAKSGSSNLQRTTILQDTIVQTIHIVRYDTIFRTIVQENYQTRAAQTEKTAMASLSLLNTTSDASPSYFQTSQPVVTPTSGQEINPTEIPLAENSIPQDTVAQPSTTSQTINNQEIVAVPPVIQQSEDMPASQSSFPNTTHAPDTTTNAEVFILEQDASDTPIHTTKTDTLTHTVSSNNQPDAEGSSSRKQGSGWQYGWISGYHTLLFPNKLEGHIVSSGFQIEKNISNRIAVGGGLRFGLASAESTDIDQRISSRGNPSLNAPAGFVFTEWDADFVPLINYQLYTHFRLANLGKTRLMAGAGAQWISMLPHTTDYLYFNPDNFNDFDLEVENDWDTRWQGLTLMLQAERKLNKRLALGMRASGLIPTQPPQSVLDQQLGLDLWLKFKL